MVLDGPAHTICYRWLDRRVVRFALMANSFHVYTRTVRFMTHNQVAHDRARIRIFTGEISSEAFFFIQQMALDRSDKSPDNVDHRDLKIWLRDPTIWSTRDSK